MTVDIERETLPLRRRKWLAFLDCGAAAELPLLPPATATSSASDIPRAFVEQQYNHRDTNLEIAGAFRALNPRPSSAITGVKDANPHDKKRPRRPASAARTRQPGSADATLQSSTSSPRDARPPSPSGGARRLIMPPRLGPGRGPPPPCCPQCGLTRFPRGPPPPHLLPRERMGSRSYPPRPFTGPRRNFPGRGMPPRPGMWWVGRGPPPPRLGMGRGPRGAMRGGYGRGRGRGGRCFCNAAMGPMRGGGGRGRPLPRPGGVVWHPPGRGGRGRGVGACPGPSCDQPSAALMSWARPEARPEDEGDFAQAAPAVSRLNSAGRNEAGLLMRGYSHKDDAETAKAKTAQAETAAVSPSEKPQRVKTGRTTGSKGYDPGYVDRGGPMQEGGMPKGRPKSAPPVFYGSTRPEGPTAESRPLPHQVDHPDRLQPAAARTTTALTVVVNDQHGDKTTRTVADGPTGGLDFPHDIARPIDSATTSAGAAPCRAAAETAPGREDGDASSGMADVGSLTATASKCDALTKAAPIAEGRRSRDLTAPSGGAAADRPAPPPTVEDVLATALQGNCIVLAGGGGAATVAAGGAPGGGWLVAAAIPPGRHTARKTDYNDNNVDDAQIEHHHEEGRPMTVTTCTQWEEDDALLDVLPREKARTLPQLWANIRKPTTTAPSDKNTVEAEDELEPDTKPDTKEAAVGGRDRANGETMEAPARGASGRGSKPKPSSTPSKGSPQPSTTVAVSREWPTPSALETPKEDNTDDQDSGGGGRNISPIAARADCAVGPAGVMSATASGPEGRLSGTSALGTQPDDVESDQDAVLGGVEGGGHPLMVSGETQIENRLGRSGTPAGCDPLALPEAVVRERSPAAGGGAAEKEEVPASGGAPRDRELVSSGEKTSSVAAAGGIMAKRLGRERNRLDRLDQTVGPSFTPVPRTQGSTGTSLDRSPGLDGVITARAPAPPEAAKIAEEEEQEEGGRMTQAKNEEEVNFLPDSLGGVADSRHILDQEVSIANNVEDAKDLASNALTDGGQGGFDALTPQTACAEEAVPTTTRTAPMTPSPSRADSSRSYSSLGGGEGGGEAGSFDAFPATTESSNRTKRLPSSNTPKHTVNMPPDCTHIAAVPLAAPGVGTTPLSGKGGVSAGDDDDVPHGVERGPEAEESFRDPSGPGGRTIGSSSSEGIGDPEEDDEESDRHAGKDDGADNGPVVVEMQETQTEDDIDAAVREANVSQLLSRARPWATQLEHGVVPDDSVGESFGTIILAGSPRKKVV